jgi:hypothetical protein
MGVAMRVYDGIEKRYCKSDSDSSKILSIITPLLGFCPTEAGLDFDLSFYSGGIGVLDKLAISCKVTCEEWLLCQQKHDLLRPAEILQFSDWAEDFLWLIQAEVGSDLDALSAAFINENKHSFQSFALPKHKLYFAKWSDVNDWTVVWGHEYHLNYAAYSQG